MEWIKILDKYPDKNSQILYSDLKGIYHLEVTKIGNIFSVGYKCNNRKCNWHYDDCFCKWETKPQHYWMPIPNQPERSKREDSQKCEMRCSEHCGNTVREVQ